MQWLCERAREKGGVAVAKSPVNKEHRAPAGPSRAAGKDGIRVPWQAQRCYLQYNAEVLFYSAVK